MTTPEEGLAIWNISVDMRELSIRECVSMKTGRRYEF